eukprot:CAMPEP_0173077730 /NCGR_PEP_ID=MMETSP1102-20130122/13513_1 /TAXON_ID=49646 /ORGANISM="Geminigera sp., Strain Caron Lab Isolate" /LENGTH=103 /DNA_ID=CAMNT_0013948499 /DNA_START=648 /DNA_END=958 /DNA_ORIENTATION=-
MQRNALNIGSELKGRRDGGRQIHGLETIDSAVEDDKGTHDLRRADDDSAREENGGGSRQGATSTGREGVGDALLRLGDEGVEVFSVGLGWRHELERREVVGDV